MYDIVVTGGDGFIAKNLEKRLKKLKVNFFLIKKKYGDLSIKANWNQIPKSRCLIHLAAKSFVPDSWSQTDIFLKKNILSTQYALEYCKKHKSKMVFASTVIYGGNYKSPLKENLSPIPKNPYHLSKLFCEKLCEFYYDTYKIDIIILRIFNTYGLFQNKKFVVPEIIEMIKKKKN